MTDHLSRLQLALTTAKDRLRDLGGLAPSEGPAGGELDADAAMSTQRQFEHLGEKERRLLEVRALTHAIERVHRGEYERCAECGEEIPAARLHAVPTAELCVAHQADIERRKTLALAGRWDDEDETRPLEELG